MRENEYRAWLSARQKRRGEGTIKAITVQTLITDGLRVEKHHGDFDSHYERDGLSSLLRELNYTIADKRAQPQRLNPSKIPIEGDIVTGLQASRQAIRSYREFRRSEASRTLPVAAPEAWGTAVLKIKTSRNPPWSRDELILALNAYIRWSGTPPGNTALEIVDLSKAVNALCKALGGTGSTTLRNANSVHMKRL